MKHFWMSLLQKDTPIQKKGKIVGMLIWHQSSVVIKAVILLVRLYLKSILGLRMLLFFWLWAQYIADGVLRQAGSSSYWWLSDVLSVYLTLQIDHKECFWLVHGTSIPEMETGDQNSRVTCSYTVSGTAKKFCLHTHHTHIRAHARTQARTHLPFMCITQKGQKRRDL